MPHITIRGISKEEVGKAAKTLKEIVVNVSEAKKEHVKVFYSPTCQLAEVKDIAVDIYWMHRPQEICDRIAEEITQYFKQEKDALVQVTFTEFPGNLFYENGTHY